MLHRRLQDKELQYALRFAVYRELLRGNQTERSVALKKIRNRMRSRQKNGNELGPPNARKKGVTPQAPRQKPPRGRLDPITEEVISLPTFRKLNPQCNPSDLMEQYRRLPRRRLPDARRYHAGRYYSWQEYVSWYIFQYPMPDLLESWGKLEIEKKD